MSIIRIYGIKCDHCTWRDDTVPFSEYERYINKPCPQCTRSLLTEDEYQECVDLIKRVEGLHSVFHALRWLNPLYYLRLILGGKQEEKTITIEFPRRKTDH